MMEITIKSFAGWGYPFIAQDYEGKFGAKEPDALLAGIILTNDTTEEQINAFLNEVIAVKASAVMAELEHLDDDHSEIFTKIIDDFLTKHGYIDPGSYEHRTSHIKKWE